MTANLALGKPARQFSTYKTHTASKAVDGNKANFLSQGSCTHTVWSGKGVWWQVDLEAVYDIREVVITNRGECCGEF